MEGEGVILGCQAIIDLRKQPHEPVTAVIEVRFTDPVLNRRRR